MAGEASQNFLNSSRCFGKYKIQTPEELQTRVNSYFDSCDKYMKLVFYNPSTGEEIREIDPQPYTWTGLALAIGLSSRNALNNYCERDEFEPILREARLKIHTQWESKLQRLGNNNGVMFALGNNKLVDDDLYTNKTTVDQNIGGQVGNPLKIEHTADDLSEAQLKAIEAILNANTNT